MATQKKLIIITSNEDIIRQFVLNKTKNTHIIDLDSGNEVTSIEKDDNNMINLDVLAQLSQLNSNNDQVYKRALDASDDSRSKLLKPSKTSADFICGICGDRAIGFNYDALSCSSCRAFFRRNANHTLENIRCLTGQGQCSIAHTMRRKCQRCRLDRCFAMGMKKDFILSENEKQRRRKYPEENRNNSSKHSSNSESLLPTFDEIDRTLMDVDDIIGVDENSNSNEMQDISFEILSVEDWITTESVRSSFLSIFQSEIDQFSSINVEDRVSALISWSQFFNQIALLFINFFRQINEFEDLHLDDRFILIKYNIFPLFVTSKCFHYNPINDCCLFGTSETAVKHRRFFMLCATPNDISDTFAQLVVSLVELTKQDPTLLSLLSTILIFSRGLSMNEDEPILKDSLAVNRAQFHYTKVLWNYLVNKWDEIQACKYFIQLLTLIFRIQSVTKTIREFFRIQCMTSDTVDQIAPLMQSVLHIS